MPLQSARFSGDPILEQCLAGTHRMLAPENDLSVMRVQEALTTQGFSTNGLDGIFGPDTGSAVSAFKEARDLQPTDPVVGPGTIGALDNELFTNPASLDPAFGEVAPFVANHVLEPFVGFELSPLIAAPLDSQRHDSGSFMLSALSSGRLIGLVAVSRSAIVINDPRVPADIKTQLSQPDVNAAGIDQPFTGTDGQLHAIILLDDLTICGRKVLTHRPSGRKIKVDLRGVICHELTHLRNDDLHLADSSNSDGTIFLDPGLATSLASSTSDATAGVFAQFVNEMNARHVAWIIDREGAGDPFAARSLQPASLAQAAHFYFAETDPVFLYGDNGYISTILARGDNATYSQIALWLRQVAKLQFSGNANIQQISAQLFLDAASAAESIAADPGAPRPIDDGLFPGSRDFV